jgi:hypothetical protein
MTRRYERETTLPNKAGLNRFVWDLRYAVVDIVPDAIIWGYTGGPRASPGTYHVRLSLGDWSQTQPLVVVKDPRVAATQADFDEQLELMLDMRADLDRIYGGVRMARSLREQSLALVQRLAEAGQDVSAIRKSAQGVADALTAIENDLMQTKNEADQDVENFPTKLDNQLAYVYGLVGETDARPTAGERERAADLKKEAGTVLARLQSVIATEIAGLNAAAAEKGATAILVPKVR